MAGAVKRTSGVLLLLAVAFIITIIVLCIIPYSGTGGHTQDAKARPMAGDEVLTDTPTTTAAATTPPPPPPPTTTTTTTTTMATTTTTTSTTTTATPTTATTTFTATTPSSTTTPTTTHPPTTVATTTTASATTTTSEPSTTRTTEPETTTQRIPQHTEVTTEEQSTTTSSTESPTTLLPITTTQTTTTSQPNTTLATTITSTSETQDETSKSSVTQESSTQPGTQTSATTSTTFEATTEALTTTESTTTSTDDTSTFSSTPSSSISSFSSSVTSTQSPATPCPTIAAPEAKDVCKSAACKTLAARMLDLMDHSWTDPCMDFYQYACGGVTDDPFLTPENRKTVTHRVILDLIKNLSEEDPDLGTVKVFYDSCISAEAESRNRSVWLPQIKEVFDAMGNAFGPGNTAGSPVDVSPVNITQVLVGMMKFHFAPFFDLLLDVSDDGADEFVLMLTPPILVSPFSEDVARAVCYGEHLNRTEMALHSESSSYNVNDEYEIYTDCMKRGKGLQARLQQMGQAVKELDLMHHFNYTIHKQGPEGLLVDNLMDTEFLLGDLSDILPRKPALREGHLKKVYEKVTLSYLETEFSFPNFKVEWVTLVEELLGHPVDPATTTVHIYFEEELKYAFEEIDFIDPPKLQRILLLLLAERLYTDLVEPAHHGLGKPEYCLQTTMELLGDLVSSLYVGGLPRIQELWEKIEEMVIANKGAAEKELNHQPYLQAGEAESWLKKLSDMTGEVPSPDPSLYLPGDINKAVLSDNFVDNCQMLLRRYRSRMYQHFQEQPSSPSVMWSHFLMPFSSSGISLYASNKFLIPYAVMEAPLFFWDVPDYLNYAGVGHMIAHELMHGFDGTGSLYNGTHRHELDGLFHFINVSECLAYQYRSPQTLTAASGLKANFMLGKLPLNEFLADSGAARLAWEAYEHSLLQQEGTEAPTAPTSTMHEPLLPWLGLDPLQLYFLRVAQKNCAPTSNSHMLSIMEDEHLPAKLRVNLVLHNEPLFTKAFHCPEVPNQCPYVLG